jgi:DNA-binding winged helix-turn-helix (wHTH) protein
MAEAAGINQQKNKSLSASRVLGNRDLSRKLKQQERSGGQPGSRPGRSPRVEPMNDLKSLPAVVRFGAFEVAFDLRELRKHGMRMQLEEKPFQILEMLIENAGQVVKRKALCEKLWPNTYVAFDHSLNTAVNKLRSVLGDVAQSPRFIETRPRLGYCFVAPVERLNGDRPQIGGRAGNASSEPHGRGVERHYHRVVMAESDRGSSRPQRVQASPLQAKGCQTAR